jgi:hypothetical protein
MGIRGTRENKGEVVKEKHKKLGTEEGGDAEEKRKVDGGGSRKSNTASLVVSIPTLFLRSEGDRCNPLLVTAK